MASPSVRAVLCALFVALSLVGGVGCESDDDGTSGAGGAAGVAGMTGGVGGATGGTSGMGVTGGAGGVAGMMTGGVGGATGGTGGTSGSGVPGCAIAVVGTPADLHAAASMAFTMSCGFGSCHNMDGNRAGLVILATDNLNTKLVDVPSCQTTVLPLVKSGGGDAALAGSWIWQKLTAPQDSSFNLVGDAAWGTPVDSCDQAIPGTFGAAMPMTGGLALSDMRLAAVRNWICAGAQAP